MAYQLLNQDIVQVTVEYAEQGVETMMNVLHYRLATGGPFTDGADAILDLVQHIGNGAAAGTFAAAWAELAANTVTINRVTGQRIWPARYAKVINEVDVVGTKETEALPPQVQAAITKRAELAVPYGIGGIRVPGIATEFELHGKLTAGGITQVEILANTLTPLLTPPGSTAVWEPIILRRGNPGSSLRVAQVQVQPTLRTQRTRIPGKGI